NERGLIDVSEESQMTSRAGVFAAGDATTGPATVIGAVTNGRKAAAGANRYLEVLAVSAEKERSGFLTSDKEGIKNTTALKLRELDADKRRLDLEDSQTPGADEALSEARRCLNCGCYAVNPSDIAPALVALNADIITNERVINSEAFFEAGTLSNTVLGYNEIITCVSVPELPAGAKSVFKKMALRKSIDFPVIGVAASFTMEEGVFGKAKIVLGAVSPLPRELCEVESFIEGKKPTEELACQAADLAVSSALPLLENRYKVKMVRALVRRAIASQV
ncbi:MAG: FAD binding domain-containing protein, partial [Clostridiales bacterium]|nr:FAD binding domain-containing protein [Clostridiales bacterium]